jgi:hypothetical protein
MSAGQIPAQRLKILGENELKRYGVFTPLPWAGIFVNDEEKIALNHPADKHEIASQNVADRKFRRWPANQS